MFGSFGPTGPEPKLRATAKSEGYADGRDPADQETTDARLATQREAEIARLRALREGVERDLAEAGPAPQPPSYDDMRAEFLGDQSAQLTAFAKTVKHSDGTTMHEAFED